MEAGAAMSGTSGTRAFRFWVNGRVQGVGFRWFVRREAQELGLTGRVRNLPDGRVEVAVAGEPEALSAFRARLQGGPPGARVTRLEEEEMSAVPDWDGFTIDR
jgi:acylphosphatase